MTDECMNCGSLKREDRSYVDVGIKCTHPWHKSVPCAAYEAAENSEKTHETTNSPTKPNEPACPECSRLASRVEELEEAYELVCFDLAALTPNFVDAGLDALSTPEFRECKEWIKREMMATAIQRVKERKK